ncbi:MAG TPA: hypothetical protein VHM24_00905 [Gemmatimonadaceae bacterium]|nr:hypothetical protein [Gemmatimonadaceae bacterium]
MTILRPLAALTVITACVDTHPKTGTSDSAGVARTGPVVTMSPVNRGTYGMSSKVKWTLSPDSSAIIALVDPVGVESEAVPNGFFYGSESRNFQTRMDSVWDVAPSPDWATIAFSRAYVVSAGGEDSIPAAMWIELSRRTGMDTATLRTGSFASSGMSMARAIAQPGIVRVPADGRAAGASDAAVPRMFPVALGWHVRWTPDGSTVALGNSPAKVQDDEESETWAALDPKTGQLHGTLAAGTQLVIPRWIAGPALELSVPVDMQGAPAISVKNGNRSFSIESSRGVITARETTSGADPASRTFSIGSGKALAATKGGRYILALAPRSTAVANEVPVEAVVYVVGW